MAIGLQSAFRQLQKTLRTIERFLKHWLVTRKNKNLPCDSKNPKLCITCHYIRDKLTDTHTVSLDKPIIVFTKHGNYVVGDVGDAKIATSGNSIIVSKGHLDFSPDF